MYLQSIHQPISITLDKFDVVGLTIRSKSEILVRVAWYDR